ncbi:MAG: CDP-glycerol glycerophosphotransferase family protein [Brevundimonas sp.]
MRPVRRSGVAVGFVLSANEDEAAKFVTSCRQNGHDPVLVRAGYEAEIPLVLAGLTVRQPIDYLDNSATDEIHAAVLDWLRALPSVRLKPGLNLADWTGRIGLPQPVWGWLSALAPYIHVSLRAIRLANTVAIKEKPAAWTFIGGGDDLDWQAPLLAQAMKKVVPQAPFLGTMPPAPASSKISSPPLWESLIPLWALRQTKTYRNALSRLKKHRDQYSEQLAFDGHAVLISRGQRGAHWLTEPDAPPRLIDDYSEGYPDALADICEERNWRLTIVWEGARPTVDGQGYADWRPGRVFELPTASFGGVASRLRRTVHAIYARALPKLFAHPNLRAAFELDGVDVWTPTAHHFLPMLVNLSVLSATQQESWIRAFEVLRPDIVVGGRLETRPWINAAAADTQARTASVKLGVGDEMALSMMTFRPDGSFEERASPDALLVWGEHQARLIENRFPVGSTRIIAVGRARNDTFVRSRPAIDVMNVRRKLGLRDHGPVIVWGGTCRSRWGIWPEQRLGSAIMAPENWVTALEALLDVARRRNGQVLVKPHPADDQNFISSRVAELGEDCVLAEAAGEGHNASLLAVSDVFVSSVSSMFSEALLAGKPSVNVWTPEIGLIYEASRFDVYSKIATPARSIEEMAVVTAKLLDDDEFREIELSRTMKAMPDLFGASDGNNARRAASWAVDFGRDRA